MERTTDETSVSEQENPLLLLKPGLVLRGEFELLQSLGRSSFGALWKARDVVANRLVALRFLPYELKCSEAATYELQDVFNLHDLHHQNIGALNILKDDPRLGFYVVMQFLSGEPLDAYVQRIDSKHEGLPLQQVLGIVKPIAAALDYAHRRRVIHRDLKPSNIFLTLDATETKVCDVHTADFGFAEEIRTILSKISQTEYRKSGSRFYTAPEQWRGRPQSAKSDQYSLAVVVYELLSGFPPFMGNDMEILRLAVLNEEPGEISTISSDTNAVLQKALAKAPEDRFETCSQFVAALQTTRKRSLPEIQPNSRSLNLSKTRSNPQTTTPKPQTTIPLSQIPNPKPQTPIPPSLLNFSGVRFEKSRVLTGNDWGTILETSGPLLMNLSDTDLSDTDMKQLAALDLRELRIGNCPRITDAGLACLKNLTQLTLLDMQRCRQISDAGLAHLKNLKNLETLHLRECDRITDLGIGCFKNCTKLRFIDLYGCERLTDNALLFLKGMPKLQRIDLAWCRKITGFGLDNLRNLAELKEISLAGCRLIKEDDLHSFQRALPNCRITG